MSRFNMIRVDLPLARQGAADVARGILPGYLRQPVTTVDMRSRRAASISFPSPHFAVFAEISHSPIRRSNGIIRGTNARKVTSPAKAITAQSSNLSPRGV